jgi:hypothetical protein
VICGASSLRVDSVFHVHVLVKQEEVWQKGVSLVFGVGFVDVVSCFGRFNLERVESFHAKFGVS